LILNCVNAIVIRITTKGTGWDQTADVNGRAPVPSQVCWWIGWTRLKLLG